MSKALLVTCLVMLPLMKSFSQHLSSDSLETLKATFNAEAKVNHTDFNQGIIHSPYQLINGRLTGVGMSGGNDPNGEFLLRVRGLSTWQQDTRPLVVIDGFVVDDLQTVDPNDIAQITLVKGAASATTYGLQGANGVFLISTKSAVDEPLISFNSALGVDQALQKTQPLSAGAYKEYPMSVDMGAEQDWLDLVTRTGISSVNNLAISKRIGSFSVRGSINSRITKGTLSGTGFDQLNFRINFQQMAFNDRLKLQMRLSATSRESQYGFREAFKYAYSSNPTMQVHDPTNDKYGGYSQNLVFDNYNPVAIIEQNSNSGTEKSSTISFNGDYKFDGKLKGFGVKLSYQLSGIDYFHGTYYSKESYYVGAGRNGLARTNSDVRKMHQFSASLHYAKSINSVNFEISSGYQLQRHVSSEKFMEGGDFLSDAFSYHKIEEAMDFQNGKGIVSSSDDRYKVVSWLTNASVFFKEKYFIQAVATYNGSTRLGENNKWGLFPAVTGGIQWSEGVSLFSYLRVRGSWGKTGNMPQSSNLSGSQVTRSGAMYFYNGKYMPVYDISRDANPDLKWEEKSEINFGADFTMLNDKLRGSIDWFNNKVTDLLSPVIIPSPPSLSGHVVANLGEIQNSGVEINLNVSAKKTMRFSWDMDFNFSHVTTKVNSLSGNGFSIGTNGEMSIGVLADAGAGCSSHGVNLIKEGAKLGQIQGPVFTGIDPGGSPQHKDINGDGVYCDCPDDFVVLGNGLPKFIFGFGHRLTFENFELSLLFRGASGHHKISSYRIYQEGTGIISSHNLVETSYFDPRLQHTHLSSSYVEKAGFLKLDNISVRYHVPSALKLSVSFTIQNLFTITKYTGSNPEVGYGNLILRGQTIDPGNHSPFVSGVDLRGNYLPSRVFSVAVGLKL